MPTSAKTPEADYTRRGGVGRYGPIPASLAQRLVADAVVDERSVARLRRLYRHPTSGSLVAMESRSRLFPKGLAGFIGVRDQTCRTPYCDAPIRHRDHALPRHRGGPTSAINGLGACERCNYTKEAPGWRVTASDENGTHTAEFVTPTGARYQSTAPPLPAAPLIAQRSRNQNRRHRPTRGVAASSLCGSGARAGRRRTGGATPVLQHRDSARGSGER
jgi:hypothetical protein